MTGGRLTAHTLWGGDLVRTGSRLTAHAKMQNKAIEVRRPA